MENEAYKELVGEYILSSKTTQITHKNLFEIYEQLKGLDRKEVLKVFKLIEYTKQNIANEKHQKRMTSQMSDELLKDIKEVIQANQTNMKMLGYSPLIGFIFNYYVYVKYFKSDVRKFKELIQQLEAELNQGVSNNLRNSTDRIVKKFFRFNSMRLTKHKEILISEKRKNNVKDMVEELYKKRIHKDTFQIIFIKILVETKLLSLNNANEISKKIFNISYYISEDNLQQKEVKNLTNRIYFSIYLTAHTGIHLESNNGIKYIDK